MLLVLLLPEEKWWLAHLVRQSKENALVLVSCFICARWYPGESSTFGSCLFSVYFEAGVRDGVAFLDTNLDPLSLC